MERNEQYRGYTITWQEPPHTTAGFDIEIVSNDENLQRRLQRYFKCGGSHALRTSGPAPEAVKVARSCIDSVLSDPQQ